MSSFIALLSPDPNLTTCYDTMIMQDRLIISGRLLHSMRRLQGTGERYCVRSRI